MGFATLMKLKFPSDLTFGGAHCTRYFPYRDLDHCSILHIGNIVGGFGVEIDMNLDRLRSLVAAPMAGLFLILMLCAFGMQMPVSSGIRIPMMQKRTVPLSNCEFNGFTVYLRSDGQIAGGDYDSVASQPVIVSRIAEARDNIQDDTIFVIADPNVAYQLVADLIGQIHRVAPADHIAVVTTKGQMEGIPLDTGFRQKWADRCQFEWPSVSGQPTWGVEDSRIALGQSMKRMSVLKALSSSSK